MKRFVLVSVLLGVILFPLLAQQAITRFAVVDVGRVIQALSGSSDAAEVKAYTAKRDKVQAEIEKLNKELQELNAKLNDAIKADDKNQIRILEGQVKTKTQSIQNYITRSFAELERDLGNLTKNSSFMTQLNNILRVVAESDGYSMVLGKQEGSGILWYSPAIDITNKVIDRIRAGGR